MLQVTRHAKIEESFPEPLRDAFDGTEKPGVDGLGASPGSIVGEGG
jgi:hypothetical protein